MSHAKQNYACTYLSLCGKGRVFATQLIPPSVRNSWKWSLQFVITLFHTQDAIIVVQLVKPYKNIKLHKVLNKGYLIFPLLEGLE
jgi:hypothetical protein